MVLWDISTDGRSVPKALCGDEASAGSARRDDLIGPSHL